MKSKSLIMKELREKRKAAGLVELKAWVTPSFKAVIKRFIEQNEGKYYERKDGGDPVVMCRIPVTLLAEITGYLIAAECGSMSMNNSQVLAYELLESLKKIGA